MSDQLIREASRGDHARQLLKDELFIEAFDTLKTRLIRDWMEAPTSDIQTQSDIHKMVRLLDNVRQFFTSVVNTGDKARHELDAMKEEDARERFMRGANWTEKD